MTGAGEPGAGPSAAMRVEHGSPTPEEIAAVTAVLEAAAAAAAAEDERRRRVQVTPRAAWDASARGLRTPLVRGPGVWPRSVR